MPQENPQPAPSTDPARRARQERIEQVFDAASMLPEGERVAFVDASGLGDTERREVIELLRYDAAEPSDRARAGAGVSVEERLVGREIGGCRLIRLVGVGGMGAVYEAQQVRPERRVAVKVLRGALAAGSAERRFRLEAELMSRLEHPGIARIYAAGTESAADLLPATEAPWFVMEFVEGARPITTAVREDDGSPESILRLFCEVLDAIAFGHARGVIHRDLKPANILVGSDGRPRVIDFGIAKAIDADRHGLPAVTATTNLIGTLQHMSPEQFGPRDAADTRSDVYALGLVLFESLAGAPPYVVPRDAGILAVARMVASAPVPLVSSRIRSGKAGLTRSLAADLDGILAKALEKEPERRYQSVGEFAADIRRALAHEPVLARRPSLGYQLSRFVARHRAFSASVAAASVALSVTTGVAVMSAREARRQRDVAAMRSAQYAVETGDFAAAQEALEETSADGRDFTWHAVASRARGWAHEIAFGQGNIYEVIAARGGEVFVSAAGDESVVVSSRTGQVLARARDPREGATTEILSFDVDEDATRVARGGMNLAPIVQSLADGRILWEGTRPKELFPAVALSPEGARVAWVNEGEPLRVTRVDDGSTLVERTFGSYIRSMDFSPDGTMLAVGIMPARLVVVDATTLEERWSTALSGREDVPDVRFSRDGRFITATSFAGLAEVFTATGARHGAVSAETMGGVATYAGEVSPDGTRVAAGAMDQMPRIEDLATKRGFRLPGHESQSWSVAWGADPNTLATTAGTLRIWNLALHDPDGTRLVGESSKGLRLSNDGSLAATIVDRTGEVAVADTTTFTEIARVPGPAQRLAVDAARRRVAIAHGGEIMVRGLAGDEAGRELARFPATDLAAVGITTVSAIEFFADGRLAVSSGNETIASLDITGGGVLASIDLRPIIQANPVVVEPGAILSLRPSGDGIAAASPLPPGYLRWSGRPGTRPATALGPMPYRRFAIGASGDLLATTDVNGAIQLIDARTMREILSCDPLPSTGRFVAIRPQGDRIAVASNARRIAIVDAASGERLVRIPMPENIGDMRFSSSGDRLVVGLVNGRIVVLDGGRAP
jgi:WD40 repeat protein